MIFAGTRSARFAWILAAGAALSACSAGPRNYLNENDRLREENLQLQEKVAASTQRAGALEKLLAIEQQRTRPPVPPGLERPLCARIELGTFSGGVDGDRDGADEAVRIYLLTLDAKSRFVVTLGRVSVSVVAAVPGQEAVTAATASFDGKTFDGAYRSGIGGTHYTLVVPVDPKRIPEGVSQLLLKVGLEDLLTGAKHETEKLVRWHRSEAAAAAAPPR